MTEQTTKRARNWRYVRLANGENVIADLDPVEGGLKLILNYPFQVLFDRSRGGMDLVMLPWIPTTASDDTSILIDEKHVLFTCSIAESVQPGLDNYAARLYNNTLSREVRHVDSQGNVETVAKKETETADPDMESALEGLAALFGDEGKKPN